MCVCGSMPMICYGVMVRNGALSCGIVRYNGMRAWIPEVPWRAFSSLPRFFVPYMKPPDYTNVSPLHSHAPTGQSQNLLSLGVAPKDRSSVSA